MRLGLDIGGTKTDAVALDAHGQVAARVRVPTAFGADGVVDTAVAAVGAVAEQLGLDPRDFSSIGAGIPGLVDVATGRVLHAVNLGFYDLELGGLLGARLGQTVRVENDVNAASLGAYHLLGLDGSMAYLNLGTGLAAGFVLDGALWRGARGTAGEIGHLPVDPNGALCSCGQRGCLETVASGSGIARVWPSDAALPVLELFDRADEGDPTAVAVRDRLIEGAAAAVRVLVLTVDVDTVVIGGGISNLGERLFDRVREKLNDWAWDSSFLASLELSRRVQPAPQDHPTAAVGAALIGMSTAVARGL